VEILMHEPLSLSGKCSPELEMLVLRMLSKDSSMRPDARELETQLARLGAHIPPRVIWLRDRWFDEGDEKYMRRIRGEFRDHALIIAAFSEDEVLLEIGRARVVDRFDEIFIIMKMGVGGGETAAAAVCASIRRFREEGLVTPMLLVCGSSEGLPPMPNVVVDTRDVAVPDYIWHVVMGNGSE
jgi:hypothetical protein